MNAYTVIILLCLSGVSPRVRRDDYWLNVGSVLFSPQDLDKSHWFNADVALLQARYHMQALLPPPNIVNPNEDFVDKLLTYFKNTYIYIQKESGTPEVDSVLTTAFSDVVGGYLKLWILPVTKFAFYGGAISHDNAYKIFELYNDVKNYLGTDGTGWRSPDESILKSISLGLRRKLRNKFRRRTRDPCDKFAYFEKSSNGFTIPIPYINWDEGTMFLPLKNKPVITLSSPKHSNTLQEYYDTAKTCLIGSPNATSDFNNKFQSWLSKEVVGHLYDDNLYVALGNVLNLLSKNASLEDTVDYLTINSKKLNSWESIILNTLNRFGSTKSIIFLIVLLLELIWCCLALQHATYKRKYECAGCCNIFSLHHLDRYFKLSNSSNNSRASSSKSRSSSDIVRSCRKKSTSQNSYSERFPPQKESPDRKVIQKLSSDKNDRRKASLESNQKSYPVRNSRQKSDLFKFLSQKQSSESKDIGIELSPKDSSFDEYQFSLRNNSNLQNPYPDVWGRGIKLHQSARKIIHETKCIGTDYLRSYYHLVPKYSIGTHISSYVCTNENIVMREKLQSLKKVTKVDEIRCVDTCGDMSQENPNSTSPIQINATPAETVITMQNIETNSVVLKNIKRHKRVRHTLNTIFPAPKNAVQLDEKRLKECKVHISTADMPSTTETCIAKTENVKFDESKCYQDNSYVKSSIHEISYNAIPINQTQSLCPVYSHANSTPAHRDDFKVHEVNPVEIPLITFDDESNCAPIRPQPIVMPVDEDLVMRVSNVKSVSFKDSKRNETKTIKEESKIMTLPSGNFEIKIYRPEAEISVGISGFSSGGCETLTQTKKSRIPKRAQKSKEANSMVCSYMDERKIIQEPKKSLIPQLKKRTIDDSLIGSRRVTERKNKLNLTV